MIVPDSFPDVQDILDTCGTVVLRSKEAQQGKLLLTGIVQTYIIFRPEGETGVRSLNTQLPFTVSVDCVEATSGTRLIATCEKTQLETRMINSRKLLIRVDIAAEFQAYESVTEELTIGLEGKSDIQLRTESCAMMPIVDVREKTFSVSDEYAFPASKPPVGRIISATARLMEEDVQTVGLKLVIKGAALVSVVYTSAASGEVCSVDFSLPFSQILEMTADEGEHSSLVSLMPTGLYVQDTGTETTSAQGLAVELAAVAQICVYAKVEATYVADFYSILCETEYESGSCDCASLTGVDSLHDTARFLLATDSQVRNIVSIRAVCGKVRKTDNEVIIPVSAAILFCNEEGELERCTGRFEYTFQASYGGVDVEFSLQYGEPYAAPTAGGIELRMPLEVKVMSFETVKLEYVASVEYKEEQTKDLGSLPSLIVRRVDSQDSIWNLAKRYNSTCELIRRANAMDESDDIHVGDLIILAKQR